MSQRKFVHKDYEVLTGWDRPLQYWFLVVERRSATDDDEDEGIVFSNLDLPNPSMTLEEIRRKLEELNIPHPPELFEHLAEDRQFNRGSWAAHYGHIPPDLTEP